MHLVQEKQAKGLRFPAALRQMLQIRHRGLERLPSSRLRTRRYRTADREGSLRVVARRGEMHGAARIVQPRCSDRYVPPQPPIPKRLIVPPIETDDGCCNTTNHRPGSC